MMWERTAELVEEAGGEVLLGQKVVLCTGTVLAWLMWW